MKFEIHIGDCFLFRANSNTYGFVVHGSWKFKRELMIKFIPVTLTNDIVLLSQVKENGLVFSRGVFSMLTGQYEPGLFMFDIGVTETELFSQLDYIGTFDLDLKKAFYSGGTVGIPVEDMVQRLLWLDNGFDGHVKMPLKNFLRS